MMRPTTMQSLVSETESYRAALATILDLDIAEIPEFTGLAAQLQWDAWMAGALNLSVLRMTELPVPPGMWLLRVRSPYPGYDVHTLVMRAGLVAHDPHPEPQEMQLPGMVLMGELLFPLDPSLPSGRLALH